MAKKQGTVHLPVEVWAQVDDLHGYFGDSRGEVIAYALRSWFGTSQREIQEQKARIDALKDRIDELNKTQESSTPSE